MLAVVLAILRKLVVILKLELRRISKRIVSLKILNIYTPWQHALTHIILFCFKIVDKNNSTLLTFTSASPLVFFSLCFFFLFFLAIFFIIISALLFHLLFLLSLTLIIGIFYLLNYTLIILDLITTHLVSHLFLSFIAFFFYANYRHILLS